MHDLMDVALVELGDTNEPMAGAENPLAMITNIVNGVEVIVSPDNSDMGSDPVRGSDPVKFFRVMCACGEVM